MYSFIFDEEAIDFLNKLEKDQKERIFNKILDTKNDPFHFFEKLSGRPEFKLRVGSHRVIADINQNDKVIQILHIGHRRNVYKKL
ncbi:MAG: type II toxin-antitoxin system RelE/ParE family toxin [Methanosarcinaceae archaeon]|nr:type II toxin-antitoxin system RelE/ParE family toxin [Methanosarcinaceae archaeon]